MRKIIHAFLNLLLLAFVKSQWCNEEIVYLLNTIEVICNNVAAFPITNKPVSVFLCVNCKIHSLEDKTMLKRFEGVTFNLSNSHLQVINKDAFKSFGLNTRRFNFENNELKYIAPKVFNMFMFLDDINFRNCKIQKLPVATFEGTKVEVLDLSQNELINITGVFKDLYVTKLNLSSNKIQQIDFGTFDKVFFGAGINSLNSQHLDLSNNLIDNVKPGSFKCGNPRNCVQVLDLQNNSIATIENGTFSDLNYLEVLLLSGNKISKLNSNSFKGLVNLNYLFLQNNRIREIPMGIFGDVQRLTLLDLSRNSLTSLSGNTFSGLLTLQILNLSHNNIQVLENSLLFPLIQLKDLDITDIKIHEIEIKGLLENHFRLRSLTLNDNFWTCQQLMQIYKQMNRQFGGFSSPSSYFNVPNLHGIACSRGSLPSYDNITFEDFLNIIYQDHNFAETLELKMMEESGVYNFNKTLDSDHQDYVRSIHAMFVVLIVIVVIVFVYFVFKEILLWLHNYEFIKSNRLSFLYTQSGNNVQVL